MSKLTLKDYEEAAAILGCDVAAIRAVEEVESSGSGFLTDGRIKVLFEGHQFCKYTRGAYTETHPTLCYSKWTRDFYTKGANADIRGDGELKRLEEAMTLDRKAALLSASYGKFQIMGFNHVECGFTKVEDFYTYIIQGEIQQLTLFCRFIKSRKLDGVLREHRWADFAKKYNGPEYATNKYDTKLATAYAKYSMT